MVRKNNSISLISMIDFLHDEYGPEEWYQICLKDAHGSIEDSKRINDATARVRRAIRLFREELVKRKTPAQRTK